MAEIKLNQMVKILREGIGSGKKGKIISVPGNQDGYYEVELYWSFWVVELKRKEFVVLSGRKTKH